MSEKPKPELDVSSHIYVPKHEVISKKEADEVLARYNARPHQLPFILLSDPALRGLNVKLGDIIKITRKSPTAGASVYYRYVVEG